MTSAEPGQWREPLAPYPRLRLLGILGPKAYAIWMELQRQADSRGLIQISIDKLRLPASLSSMSGRLGPPLPDRTIKRALKRLKDAKLTTTPRWRWTKVPGRKKRVCVPWRQVRGDGLVVGDVLLPRDSRDALHFMRPKGAQKSNKNNARLRSNTVPLSETFRGEPTRGANLFGANSEFPSESALEATNPVPHENCVGSTEDPAFLGVENGIPEIKSSSNAAPLEKSNAAPPEKDHRSSSSCFPSSLQKKESPLERADPIGPAAPLPPKHEIIITHDELGISMGPAQRPVFLDREIYDHLIPPRPDLHTPITPFPPRLGDDPQEWPQALLDAFWAAMEARSGRRCWLYRRGDGLAKKPAVRKMLTQAAAQLHAEEIRPIAWCEFSLDRWMEMTATRTRGRPKEPTIKWLFGPKRIAKELEWFFQEDEYCYRWVRFTPTAHDVLGRYDQLDSAMRRCATLKEAQAVRDRLFPGNSFDTLVAKAQAEADEAQHRMKCEVVLGGWVWGERSWMTKRGKDGVQKR